MDLNAPLGMTPVPPQRRSRLVVFGGGLAMAACAGLALALAWGDPHGGHPFATVDVPPASPPPTPQMASDAAAPLDATPTGTTAPPATAPTLVANPRAATLEGGVLVHRGAGNGVTEKPEAGGPLVIDVSRALDAPFGTGRNVVTGHSRAGEPIKSRRPRVAIFVSGMGLDASATRAASETMPAAVTLAFVPNGNNVSAAVSAAKDRGHEVLLQLPMRNGNGSTPGPHALRPDAPAQALKTDLAWHMDRFAGYDGVSNLLGATMTADTAAMTIVLTAVRARHLFYLDDGTSRQSVAPVLAPDLGVDVLKADLVLDATSDPAVVRANLDQLVSLAKRKGQAIGMASGLPEHLGAIARFAADLGAKGVELVPVNALSRGDTLTPPAGAASR